jgi:hypothetical protein
MRMTGLRRAATRVSAVSNRRAPSQRRTAALLRRGFAPAGRPVQNGRPSQPRRMRA